MTTSLVRIGLPSTIWLSSVVIVFADYAVALDFGPISAVSWLVIILGVVHFINLIR